MPPSDGADSRAADDVKLKLKNLQLLDKARAAAARSSTKFKSESYRKLLVRHSTPHLCFTPYKWQLDVTEALKLGLDCTVRAGTSFGKTTPFILDYLTTEGAKKITLVVSPLNALEADQVCSFIFRRTDNALILEPGYALSFIWSSGN